MKQDELNRGSQKTLVFIEINKHSNRCMYSSFFWQNHTSIKFFFELFKKYKNQRSTSPKKIYVITKRYTNTAVQVRFIFQIENLVYKLRQFQFYKYINFLRRCEKGHHSSKRRLLTKSNKKGGFFYLEVISNTVLKDRVNNTFQVYIQLNNL